MTIFEVAISLTVGVLSILSVVSPFVYKVIRGNIMEEAAKMVNRKIESFDKKNEEIRTERQIRYVENIDGIRKAMEAISRTLNKIESDLISYGRSALESSLRIDNLEKAFEKMKEKK